VNVASLFDVRRRRVGVSYRVALRSARALLASVAMAAALVACAPDRPGDDAAATAPVVALASPAGEGAGEPNLSPAEDGVVLSWLEPAGDEAWSLRVARYRDDTWGPAHTVVTRDDLFVNWADFPSVVELSDGRLAAHWLQRGGEGGYDYGVRVSLSGDDGATWSEPWTPHEDRTPTEHGFVSLTARDQGALGVLWLDGRRFATTEDGPATREMRLMSRELGPDGAPEPEYEVDDRVCDCCQTSMARTDRGWLAVYRDRTGDEIRDIYAARLENGVWSEGQPVHRDGWVIDACPVNGPQVAAAGDEVAVAWFTAATDVPRVLISFSQNGGEFFTEPVRVDGGDPVGRVDVIMDGPGAALVTWIERAGEGAELRMRRVRAGQEPGPPVVFAETAAARGAGFPRTTLLPDGGVLAAWTDVSIEPRTLRLARLDPPSP
jgi:hypothetical protein